MNKPQGYFIAIAVVITLVYLMYGPSAMDRHPGPFNADLIPNLSSSIVGKSEEPSGDEPQTVPQTPETQTELVKKRIRNMPIPSTETAREEIAKNPHTTPPSLLKSAIMMNKIFDDVKDESSAKLFLSKMRECASPGADTPVSMKSSCLRYMDRLQRKFPQMENEIRNARSHASKEAIDLEKASR